MDKATNSSINIITLLTLLFIGLKLTNFIDWSWWWVLSPLWIPVVLFFIIGTAAYIYQERKK
jgi:hypothetical protein